VPEGKSPDADKLMLLFNAEQYPEERTWFDDAGIFLLKAK
jgi:hypothetical protein